MLPVPVAPVASRTTPVMVWVPLSAEVVLHGIVIGPRDEPAFCVPTSRPSTLSVNVFDDPLVPSAHSTTQTVPLTVAPAFGCVMKTLIGLGGGGGGDVCRMATAIT